MESKSEWVKGAVIVGGGPSGLATAACLQQHGVPCVVLERAECVASLWQQRTYDRLRLHLPKHFCELPLMPIPDHFPTYPSKDQFVAYLKAYATRFGIQPLFRRRVESARYDRKCGMWRVTTVATGEEKEEEEVIEYLCRWLVVATGENAEPFVPEFPGSNEFRGSVIHSSSFKSGAEFSAKRVLVVGCANSGMEISLDLCNHNAFPSMVVRSSVHVLPREIMGMFSTFGVAIWLMKWIPVWVVDMLLIMLAWLMLGSTKRYGITRPSMGPLQLKSLAGRTPVLDVGAMALIRKGRIKVMPALECLTRTGARFVNGQEQDFDAVILATGYRSNVPSWLKDCTFFSEEGIPNTPFPNGWKGENGLYAVGFTGKGILGASVDAVHIADDIQGLWNKFNRHISFCNKLTRHLSFRLIRTSSSSSLSSSTPSTPQSLSLSPRFRSSAPRSAPSSSLFSRSGFIHEEAMKHIS